LLQSRNSIHDLVREELKQLMGNSRLGGEDRRRLQTHFDAIRDVEVEMGDLAAKCSSRDVEVAEIEAVHEGRTDPHQVEQLVRLHLSLVAMAFACNYRRAVSLQWGDPYDATVYDVPGNERGWPFSFIMHRAQSNSLAGDDPLAEIAHVHIDRLRMATLASGLDHFAARGLADQSFVMWTTHYANTPAHSFLSVPHIVWGSGGGYLKQAQFIDAGSVGNNRLLNTLISAAIQETGSEMSDFGEGTPGQLDIIRV